MSDAVLGAGIQVVLGMDDVRQRLGILSHLGHVQETADVAPAMTDEDGDSGFLL